MTDEPPTRVSAGANEFVVGVRLVGEGDVTFCASRISPHRPGEWVLVTGVEGNRIGRIVIVDRQLKGCPDNVTSRVLSTVGPDEVAERAYIDQRQAVADTSHAQFGSTGLPDAPKLESSDWLRSGQPVSREDARFQTAKRDFPRLGQSVATREGAASVIAVDSKTRTVRCRLDDNGTEIVSALDDLTR